MLQLQSSNTFILVFLFSVQRSSCADTDISDIATGSYIFEACGTSGLTCSQKSQCTKDSSYTYGHKCVCPKGTFGNGRVCYDECDKNNKQHVQQEQNCTDNTVKHLVCTTANNAQNVQFAMCVCQPGLTRNKKTRKCHAEDACEKGMNFMCFQNTKCLKGTNGRGLYTCPCLPGYTRKSVGEGPCEDLDECAVSGRRDPCKKQSNTRCVNQIGIGTNNKGYTCECIDGYEKDPNGGVNPPCIEINECESEQNQPLCPNENTECVDLPAKEKKFECRCMDMYTRKDGTNTTLTCQNIDECAVAAQNKTSICPYKEDPTDIYRTVCEDADPDFYCNCADGFKENRRSRACVDINECTKNSKTLCPHPLTTCMNLPGDKGKYKCKCIMKGYEEIKNTNPLECQDVDECKAIRKPGDSLCPLATQKSDKYRTKCVNKIGSFSCDCPDVGFELDESNQCIDIDECDVNATICLAGSYCVNTVGSFKCVCQDGFQPDPKSAGSEPLQCIDVDECLSPQTNPCPTNTSKCRNTPGSYMCECFLGFRLQFKVKCIDTNECQDAYKDAQVPKCDERNDPKRAECINTIGSFTCKCLDQFVGDGHNCSWDPKYCDNCDKVSTNCVLNQLKGYQCKCKKGFKYDNSEHHCADIKECANPTLNDCDLAQRATCGETKPGYTCKCRRNYEGDGKTCKPIDYCGKSKNPCEKIKKSICINNPDLVKGYSCNCPKTYTWAEESNELKGCVTQPEIAAHNCTTCKDIQMRCNKTNPVKVKCACPAGNKQIGAEATQSSCQDINECNDNTDSCDELAICTNKIATLKDPEKYTCKCPEGYKDPPNTKKGSIGRKCDDIDECTEFLAYYDLGKDDDICASNNDPDNEDAPTQSCKNSPGSYACICNKGYVPNDELPLAEGVFVCTDEDECAPQGINNCSVAKNEVCKNTPGSFECNCRVGFERKGESCVDVDECKKGKDSNGKPLKCPPPKQGGTCINNPGSYACGCQAGYNSTGMIAYQCADINECNVKKKCGRTQSCINTPGSFKCTCPSGTKKLRKLCRDINECKKGLSKCHNTTECVNIKRPPYGYDCKCKVGYSVTPNSKASPDKECAVTNQCNKIDKKTKKKKDICGDQGICEYLNALPGYKCDCKSTAIVIDQQTCLGPLHCDTANEFKCGSNSACNCPVGCQSDKYKCFKCECVPNKGYECPGATNLQELKSKKDCTAIDLCITEGCPETQTCTMLGANEKQCTCINGGYKLDGTKCVDINECVTEDPKKKAKCPAKSKCVNIEGSYLCDCIAGFHLVDNDNDPTTKPDPKNPICKDLDECKNPSWFNCSANTTCVNTVGSYKCECNKGYKDIGKFVDGLLSCDDINECSKPDDNDCDKNAKCTNAPGSFGCTCNKGYVSAGQQQGRKCNDVDECDPAHPKHNCSASDHTSCVNKPGTYACNCVAGFTIGQGNKCENMDECKLTGNAVCPGQNMQCKDAIGSYDCVCKDGYELLGRNCKDIDECQISTDTCDSFNETCVNTGGSYKCDCKSGFKKPFDFCKEPSKVNTKECTCKDIDECKNDKTCADNAVCTNYVGTSKCACKKGYIGNAYKKCTEVPDTCDGIDNCKVKPYLVCKMVKVSFAKQRVPVCKCKPNYIQTTKAALNSYKSDKKFRGQNIECAVDPCKVLNGGCRSPSRCIPKKKGKEFEAKCKCPYPMDSSKDKKGCDVHDFCKCGKTPCISKKVCDKNSKCINSDIGYSCSCNTGFEPAGKDKCKDIDECKLTEPACSADATCENNIGSFDCNCPNGTIYSKKSRKCLSDINCEKQGKCPKDNTICVRSLQYIESGAEQYFCQCKSGYEGEPMVTCIAKNYCKDKNRCGVNMDCTDLKRPETFSCDCKKGYKINQEEKCEDIDECQNPNTDCPADSECSNTPGSFSCKCDKGFEKVDGTSTNPYAPCKNTDECAKKDTNNCDNKNEDCIDNPGSYTCKCNKFTMRNSEGKCVDKNECEMKEFKCAVKNTICEDKINGYDCDCPKKGFTATKNDKGVVTECKDIDECKLKDKNQVCDDHATCINTIGSFSCDCNPPFYGSGANHECYENTTCPDKCDKNANCMKSDTKIHNCTCNQGYAGNGKTCTDVDECKDKSKNDCHDNAKCDNLVGSYNCLCKPPFGGNGKTSCDRINYCETGPNDCPTEAQCKNIPNAKKEPFFNCICPTGFKFDQKNRSCTDVNECDDKGCPDAVMTCTNTDGSFKCSCPKQMIKKGSKCEDRDECVEDPMLCKPGGKCQNIIAKDHLSEGYKCSCLTGHKLAESKKECEDINECENKDTKACDDVTTDKCINTDGSFKCICKKGYEFKDISQISCKDKNECSDGTDDCDPSATCTNTEGSFTCKCKAGFSGDGKECQELALKCNSGAGVGTVKKCGKNANCNAGDLKASKEASCSCMKGYSGDAEKQCDDINECTNSKGEPNDICLTHSTCLNTKGSHRCNCDEGYKKSGANCVDINECVELDNACGKNTRCSNSVGNYSCDCISGFNGNAIEGCVNINECKRDGTKSPCSKNADCLDLTPSAANNNLRYKCTCKEGFTGSGVTCTDVNNCDAKNELNDCDTHARCDNTVGGYNCTCNTGYTGDGRKCENIDECADKTINDCDPKNGICTDNQGSYSCTCKPGYDGSKKCKDIDECNSPDSNICDQHKSTCKNTDGDYECTCKAGFETAPSDITKKTCIDENECVKNKSICGIHTCQNEEPGFRCACKKGYINADPRTCVNDNECKHPKQVCDKKASCTDTVGSFKCKCNAGYSGDGKKCSKINFCEPNPCRKNADCTSLETREDCKCKPGFKLTRKGNESTCTDINECRSKTTPHNCLRSQHLKCVNLPGSFKCICKVDSYGVGYKREYVNGTGKCVDINECKTAIPKRKGMTGEQLCAQKPGKRCKNTKGSFTCECFVPGYRESINYPRWTVMVDVMTCVDINECKEAPNVGTKNCSDKAGNRWQCKNDVPWWHCECVDPNRLVNRGNKDECIAALSCKNDVDCTEHGKCGEVGICNPDNGFSLKYNRTADIIVWEDINECRNKDACNLDCDTQCVNTIGSYNCICPKGKILLPTGCRCVSSCEEDIKCLDWLQTCKKNFKSMEAQCELKDIKQNHTLPSPDLPPILCLQDPYDSLFHELRSKWEFYYELARLYPLNIQCNVPLEPSDTDGTSPADVAEVLGSIGPLYPNSIFRSVSVFPSNEGACDSDVSELSVLYNTCPDGTLAIETGDGFGYCSMEGETPKKMPSCANELVVPS